MTKYMKDRHIFVDTNILVYAHDQDSGEKHRRANEQVIQLWHRPYPPSISVQVLQELFVSLVKKGAEPTKVRDLVSDYLAWEVIENSATLLVEAMDIKIKYKISFWDASIIAAAKKAGANSIWSEDLSHEQDYDGIRIINPLR